MTVPTLSIVALAGAPQVSGPDLMMLCSVARSTAAAHRDQAADGAGRVAAGQHVGAVEDTGQAPVGGPDLGGAQHAGIAEAEAVVIDSGRLGGAGGTGRQQA